MELNHFGWSLLLLVNIRIGILMSQLLNSVGDFSKANGTTLKSGVNCGLGDDL